MNKSQLQKEFQDEFYWLDDAPAKRMVEWFQKKMVTYVEEKKIKTNEEFEFYESYDKKMHNAWMDAGKVIGNNQALDDLIQGLGGK
ncbi:MAG: hypothetical protein EHM34_04760 [Nitrosopumilales archaeon]|nr:MAG: hypothetical protein EHM34_04760 [Nitrosopumilales archaeon]